MHSVKFCCWDGVICKDSPTHRLTLGFDIVPADGHMGLLYCETHAARMQEWHIARYRMQERGETWPKKEYDPYNFGSGRVFTVKTCTGGEYTIEASSEEAIRRSGAYHEGIAEITDIGRVPA